MRSLLLFEEIVVKVLENTHNLITWDKGQNYLFNGCMAFLMECLCECAEYDYWFFSGVTGDSFTQLHRADYHKPTTCLSADMFDYTLVEKAFDACGYKFVFTYNKRIQQDKKKWQLKIEKYINKGLPIIAYGDKFEEQFYVICGYDSDRNCVLILKGDSPEPSEYNNILDDCEVLLFVDDKKLAPPLTNVYRKAVMNIPDLMTRPSENGLVFGKRAFEDWAESLSNGKFSDIDETEQYITWKTYGTYLCMLGTNGASREFIKKVLKLNPDMTFIEKLIPIYERQHAIFVELAYGDGKGGLDYKSGGMAGGFNITAEKLKNPNITRPIGEKIWGLAKCCDEILEVFREL